MSPESPRFECRRCGACCRVPGHVRLRREEPERLAAHLGMNVDRFINTYCELTRDRTALSLIETGQGCCVFFDADDGCQIQPVKPRQCRDFPLHWQFSNWKQVCASAGGDNR